MGAAFVMVVSLVLAAVCKIAIVVTMSAMKAVGVLYRVLRKPPKRSPQRSHVAVLVVAHVALFQVVSIVVIIFIITIIIAALAVLAATAAIVVIVAHAAATVATVSDLKGPCQQHSSEDLSSCI